MSIRRRAWLFLDEVSGRLRSLHTSTSGSRSRGKGFMTGSGRRRTLRFGLLLLLLSLIPAQFALASDDSVTGQLDPALDQCGEATFGPPQIPPTNWVDGVVAYADGCSGAAFQGGFDIAAMQANRAGWEANAALRDSQSTANATVLTAAGIVTAAVTNCQGRSS